MINPYVKMYMPLFKCFFVLWIHCGWVPSISVLTVSKPLGLREIVNYQWTKPSARPPSFWKDFEIIRVWLFQHWLTPWPSLTSLCLCKCLKKLHSKVTPDFWDNGLTWQHKIFWELTDLMILFIHTTVDHRRSSIVSKPRKAMFSVDSHLR